ncbi:MAG: hypothetical protein DHS20C15_14060 [Planctomycetota bacterium]|nr:MAG: hypothetical protein DHS20C15_14060 [Planctomycetota bacterium]
MQSPFVFKLTSLALVGLSLGPLASAQGQDVESAKDVPRLRVQRALLPQDVASATPSLGMLRSTETPRLGVMVELSSDGILVKEVQEDSLAAAAGVKSGDLLLSLNGERLAEVGDIGQGLASVEPGAEFQIGVVREGEGLVKLDGKRPAVEVKEQPKADGHRGAFLGVSLSDAADGGGVSVGEVYDNTAAWFAGLEAGDVLTKVGDTEVNSAADVASTVAAQKPGHTIALNWTRGDASFESSVRLGHRGTQVHSFGNQSFPGFVIPRGNARGGAFNLRFPGDGEHDGQIFRWENGSFPHRLDLDELHQNLDGLKEHLKSSKAHPDALRFHLKGDDGAHHSDEHGNVFFGKLHEGNSSGPHTLDVQQVLKDVGINLEELKSGAKQLQIKIDGDKVEVITDGEVKQHELDASSALSPSSKVLYSFSTTADFPTTVSRVISVETNGACKVETDCEAECEADPDCEVEVDCEVECDGEAELDAAIEELAAETSDDDLL